MDIAKHMNSSHQFTCSVCCSGCKIISDHHDLSFICFYYHELLRTKQEESISAKQVLSAKCKWDVFFSNKRQLFLIFYWKRISLLEFECGHFGRRRRNVYINIQKSIINVEIDNDLLTRVNWSAELVRSSWLVCGSSLIHI